MNDGVCLAENVRQGTFSSTLELDETSHLQNQVHVGRPCGGQHNVCLNLRLKTRELRFHRVRRFGQRWKSKSAIRVRKSASTETCPRDGYPSPWQWVIAGGSHGACELTNF